MNLAFFPIAHYRILWIALALLGLYFIYRFITGRIRFKGHLFQLEGEGIIRRQSWVLIRVWFPLIHRITFTHIFLTKKRLVLFHAVTRNKMLQTPVGPKGSPGKEQNLFKAERANLLTFTSPIRGGGRIRMHLKDANGWFDDIVEQG
jgi:hypothetical protein